MPKEAGDTVFTNSSEITFDSDPDQEIDAGSAVTANDDGSVSIADAGAGDELTGITGSNTNSDSKERAVVDGVVIAKVASGVGAGVDVDVGDSANGNAGVLVASSGGPAHTLSAEGGAFQGVTLAAGVAAVKVE